MCGRFTLHHYGRDVAARFLFPQDPDWQPRYNLAPTQPVLAVRRGDDGREAARLRWGLVPSWSKGPGTGPPLINARADTAATKPAFRDALKKRRCLVVADGFFEWKTAGKDKQPYYFTRADGGLFAFAGMWERWGDGPLESVALLTTEANDLLRDVHDRMPVILSAEDEASWLDPSSEAALVAKLLRPYPSEEMDRRPVGAFVGSPRNDGPRCIEPVAAIQRSLF